MNNPITRLALGILLLCQVPSGLKAQTAVLLLNEIDPNRTGNRDLIEFFVVSAGNTAGILVQRGIGTLIPLDTMPSVNVAVGDIIVVHLNPSSGAGDAPASETVSKNQYPQGIYTGNFDPAWDFLGVPPGLSYSNGVLIAKTSTSIIQDAVPFATSGTIPTGFPADLQSIQAQGFWLPLNCGGAPCEYTSTPTAQSVSVNWAGLTSTTSMQRNSNTDANNNSDWVILPSTFGVPNQGQTVSVQDVDFVPRKFTLNQNFPNPFNPTSTIRFDLPNSNDVVLKVYDVLGKEIATLVNEALVPGTHETTFDGSELASGIYFYRIQAGQFVETRMLVLLK
ncbi:MAG: T9SS type A sorting domain-containing protein [Bacteroidota bacterium]